MRDKTLLLWVLTIIFTMAIAAFQRMTGPTYPVRGTTTINDIEITFKLPRSHGGEGDEFIKLDIPDTNITGQMNWKRLNSRDDWTSMPLFRVNNYLSAPVPHQPPAGKIEYVILLKYGDGALTPLTDEVTVIRFKGDVPLYILIPHILFMFLAMLFSSRTGLAALMREEKILKLAIYTVVFLFIGGIILGPVVQKFAFGAFWTGWPFGHDLTDNKTAVALLFWLIAIWQIRKDPGKRWWAVVAAVILLAVYLIPHSVLGSEIDYTRLPQ